MEPTQCIKDMVEYIQVSSDLISSLQKEAADLNYQLASRSNIEKAASFSSDSISNVVKKMVDAGFVKEAEASVAESRISADPAIALQMLEKLASDEIASHTKPIVRSKERNEKVDENTESESFYNSFINKLSRVS